MKHRDFYLHFLITNAVGYISILAFSFLCQYLCFMILTDYYPSGIFWAWELLIFVSFVQCGAVSPEGFEKKCSYNVPGTGANAWEVGGSQGYLLSSMMPGFCWPLFEWRKLIWCQWPRFKDELYCLLAVWPWAKLLHHSGPQLLPP